MKKFYHITDQLSSRGGYKASKENIKLYKLLFKGPIFDLYKLKKNYLYNFKFQIYKIVNYIFKLLFLKKIDQIAITFPQFFSFFKNYGDQKKVFFVNYSNMIFNYNLIEKNPHSKFIIFLYDEWPLQGLYHFNYKLNEISFLNYISKYFQKKKLNLLIKKNVLVLASTNYLKNEYYKLTNSKNIIQIFYPIDHKFWINKKFNQANKHLFLEKNFDYVLFIARGGSSNFRKGGDLLIKILEKFKKNKKIKFLILGEYNTEYIKKRFKNVEFLSIENDNDLRNLYSCVKVNLTLSRYENLPYSIIESLCCRVLNVSIDVGGIKEIISHRSNGWIIKNKKISSICEGIEWCLKNHSKLKKFVVKVLLINLIIKLLKKIKQ